MQEAKITVPTADGPMGIHLAAPAARGTPRRGVVLLHEAYGVNAHVLRLCDRLAAAGYVAAAPELFHRSGAARSFGYEDFASARPILTALTNDQIVSDARAAVGFLAARSDVNRRQLVALGFCLGGFAAALAACHLPLAAAVAFYGGGLTRQRPGFALRPLLDDLAGLGCPALFIFGADDENIPPADIETLRRRLEALGKPHEIVVYPGARHGFFCEDRKSYNVTAAESAWKKTRAWLDARLAPPVGA